MNDLRHGSPASPPVSTRFSLTVDAAQGRLAVHGELDEFNSQLMVIAADLLGSTTTRTLVVDLTAVSQLSEAAVTALALLDERQRTRHKRLELIGISDSRLPALGETCVRGVRGAAPNALVAARAPLPRTVDFARCRYDSIRPIG